MNFINQISEILAYCDKNTSPQDEVLYELERQTHLTTLSPQMISGHYQGRLLSVISRLIKPTNILEIGTFTCYSALCLAEGLEVNGNVHTIDPCRDYDELIMNVASKSPYFSNIIRYKDPAEEILPQMENVWDLVFVDAVKQDYPLYFSMVKNKVRAGGVVIADNVLLYAEVLKENKNASAQALDSYNQSRVADRDWTTIILPIRDSLSISVKNK